MTYLPQVCPDDRRALALVLHTAIAGVAAGISASLWGFFAREAGGAVGVDEHRFTLYLGLLIASQLVLIPFFARLRETQPGKGFPAPPMFAIRLARFASGMFGLASQIEREERERAKAGG
jgi:hypothetical protein